jgi:hypothetical protein
MQVAFGSVRPIFAGVSEGAPGFSAHAPDGALGPWPRRLRSW